MSLSDSHSHPPARVDRGSRSSREKGADCQTASERATVTLISKHKHTQVYVRARRTAPSPSKSRPRRFSMALFADSTTELTCPCRAGRQQITSHTQGTILSQLSSDPCLRLHTQVQGCASICICICIRICVHMCMCMRILIFTLTLLRTRLYAQTFGQKAYTLGHILKDMVPAVLLACLFTLAI